MGKRKLEIALRLYKEKKPDAEEPAVSWLPFQLNPDIPPAGISRAEYLQRKFGSPTRSYARVAAVGETVGIPFEFDSIKVQPNTVTAHRLMNYAARQGCQDEMAEELFKAYFIEGADLTRDETLADVAARAGCDRQAVLDYLASDTDADAIREADAEARNAGIGGVPFFIFNRKVGVSGAQDPGTLLEAMLQAETGES